MSVPITKEDLPPGWRLSKETEGAAVRSEGRFVAVVRPSQFSSYYVWSIMGFTSEHRVDSHKKAFAEADEWVAQQQKVIRRRKEYGGAL